MRFIVAIRRARVVPNGKAKHCPWSRHRTVMRLTSRDSRIYWQKRVDDLAVLKATRERQEELQVSTIDRSWRSCVVRNQELGRVIRPVADKKSWPTRVQIFLGRKWIWLSEPWHATPYQPLPRSFSLVVVVSSTWLHSITIIIIPSYQFDKDRYCLSFD